MKAYLLAVSGAILLSALLTLLLPGGKLSMTLKSIVKIFVLSVVLLPITDFLKDKKMDFSSEKISVDSSYLTSCIDMIECTDEEEIASYLSDTYGLRANVDAEREAEGAFPLKKITVNIVVSVINDADEHIHIIDQVKEALCSEYRCEVEVFLCEMESESNSAE